MQQRTRVTRDRGRFRLMMGFGLLFVAHAVFGNFIYDVDRAFDGGSVKGTIETNALGLLTNATLKDFRLQLTDGIGHAFELKYPDDAPSTSYSVVGDALTATDAALIFDWNRPNTRSQFSFFNGSVLWDWILETTAAPAAWAGTAPTKISNAPCQSTTAISATP